MNLKEDRFPILLRGAWFGMNKAFREKIIKLGLTTSQYTILRCLSENPGISQDELTRLIGGNKNNASALIKRMVAAKLIIKRPREADKRAYQLLLCSKGKSAYRDARMEAIELRKNVISSLPKASEEELISLLNKCL
ncbi:MAG TPA: MarR family transcriptional regulator [Opitutae bacterium]|nr:MarR family transcriptional regulator [Opitutae bacterium]